MKKQQLAILALIAVFVFAGQAFALVSLPDSSYQNGAWNGVSHYTQNSYDVWVEFAVYDKAGGNEWSTEAGWSVPGGGRYIYAYQIFNDAEKDVTAFNVFGKTGGAISASSVQAISWLDDDTDGKAPTSGSYRASDSSVVWEFSNNSVLAYSEHSWIMAFTSDYAPTAGSYSFTRVNQDPSVPTPEPASMALLGGCGLMHMLSRKKRLA